MRKHRLPAIIVKKDYKDYRKRLQDLLEKKKREYELNHCIHDHYRYTKTEQVDHGNRWDIVRIETIYVEKCSFCHKVLRKYRLKTVEVEEDL